MKTCKHCHNNIPKNEKICNVCGKKQRKIPFWGYIIIFICIICLFPNNDTKYQENNLEKNINNQIDDTKYNDLSSDSTNLNNDNNDVNLTNNDKFQEDSQISNENDFNIETINQDNISDKNINSANTISENNNDINNNQNATSYTSNENTVNNDNSSNENLQKDIENNMTTNEDTNTISNNSNLSSVDENNNSSCKQRLPFKAICNDDTISYQDDPCGDNYRGMCSGHGGIKQNLGRVP